ncbi:hypothetical protein VNI00_015092 [Paramarasmius palmivorus]|uniref:chitin synthase n=1 Tax=Paramarasmius palmivorus TaxID=297713 RepID=A0AAW0BMT5_9AGAR
MISLLFVRFLVIPKATLHFRKTIDSLAQLKYDDKRKLIVVICDGMIVGSGNDRPNAAIVLDILGADPNLDPEPLSFVSLGEGAKQHNMGKVYSGLYECSGHVVPYLVIVKVGPLQRTDEPVRVGDVSPDQECDWCKPTFYEYLFTVDADTTVDKFSVNRLISAMIHDKKLLGVCGETELANAKQSIITMMQVYEYFISHHMAKAFESLFGSVTCLPGCFTLYRLRTPDTHKPLLISNQIITDYSENRVDTLHMKNLLHLGEDRYLTTLLLKHFPSHKTQFVRDAHAYTVAPMIGRCCYRRDVVGLTRRFVVMIDLVSTLIQPVTVVYIVYLIVNVARGDQAIPLQSLIMLAAIYGLQALVFILRRKWDMIGWMIFYIWLFRRFRSYFRCTRSGRWMISRWGATRLVLGESGKKIIVHDEGKFDPRAIPLKSWSEYENELWDKESNHSIGSWVPPTKFKNDGYAESHTASLYGRETVYDAGTRGYSPAPSGMYPPPGYQSGRNTPLSHMQMPMATMSMASFGGGMPMHQPTPSRPASNYLDLPFDSRSPNASPPGSPSDAEIERAVQGILRNVDLNTVTKRELRRQLEEQFGMDLTAKKGMINAAIDRCLADQA